MPVTRPNPEKLAAVMKTVSPAVARFVVREIEVNRRRGQDEPIYEMVLQVVRGVIRESGEKVERIQTPMRLFCSFFEEFLVDRTLEKPQRGRIDRASIGPVWDWLTSGWGPADLSPLVGRLETEIKRQNSAGVAALAMELCNRGGAAIRKGISAIQGDEKEQRRLAVQLGGARVLQDAVQIQRILTHISALARMRSVLPHNTVIRNEEHIDRLTRILKQGMSDIERFPELPIALMMGRLSRPIDVTRIVCHALGVREAARIAPTQYAATVNLLIYDMGLLGMEITDCVRHRKGVAATLYWLSRLHEYSTELMDRIEINLKSDCGQMLLQVRNGVSAELNAEISKVPISLKELYRRRPNFAEGSALKEPDQISVFDAMHGLVLTVGCRPYLDQLSLNQIINSTDIEVRRYLRVVSDALLVDVRATDGAAQQCALAWFDTAVQFTRVVFGEEDAKLLARSGQVASRAVAS